MQNFFDIETSRHLMRFSEVRFTAKMFQNNTTLIPLETFQKQPKNGKKEKHQHQILFEYDWKKKLAYYMKTVHF